MDNLVINIAEKNDIKDILEIYSYYILNSPATFEIDVPNINEFSARVLTIQKNTHILLQKLIINLQALLTLHHLELEKLTTTPAKLQYICTMNI